MLCSSVRILDGAMTGRRAPADKTPGILYYDPNATTLKMALATLRMAGYEVFHARTQHDAVSLCSEHGPGGDGSIVALLLDASVDPKTSSRVLRALVQLPSADELPGILITSVTNPTPIPGAEALPALTRPFSSDTLLRTIRESLADHPEAPLAAIDPREPETLLNDRARRLDRVLRKHLAQSSIAPATVLAIEAELDADEHAGPRDPVGPVALRADLSACGLEYVLEMLDASAASGVLTVTFQDAVGRLTLGNNRIRVAEYHGDDEDLKLGRFIVQGDYMNEADLEAFAVGKDPEGRPLGHRLVEAEMLRPVDLAKVLVEQAREIACHMLAWRDGTARFVAVDAQDSLVATTISHAEGGIPIAEALLDGLRRLDERALMGLDASHVDDVYVRIDEQIARLGRSALTREELTVLELINGRNSVKELARKTRTGTFGVARVMYRLARSNLVRRSVEPVTV